MNGKMKNFMWAAIAVGVLLAGFSSVGYVKTYYKSINPSEFRNYAVTAEGKVVAVPDVASFTFSVVSEINGDDISGLQEENVKKVNQIIDYIKSEDVDKKDIKTQTYNLNPRYQYFSCRRVYDINGVSKPCPPPEIVGYTLTQKVAVKVRDFSKIGDILSGAVSNGANNVSQLSFVVDDIEAVKNVARADAIAKAQEKAESVADAGGFKIGKILSISEGYASAPVYKMYAAESMDMGMGGEAPAPTIEPGSQDVTVNMTLVFEMR